MDQKYPFSFYFKKLLFGHTHPPTDPVLLLILNTASFTTTTPITPFSGYNLYYAVDLTAQHITFAVEAATTGWIGFGIAEAAGMKGADIMMGHVDSTGKAVVGDYHSVTVSCLDFNSQ